MLISPIILVLGIVVIGLAPFLFNETILAHAAEAIYGEPVKAHIQFCMDSFQHFICL